MKIKNFAKAALFARETKFMTKHISNILDGQTLTLLDVGAAGDIEPRWKRIDALVKYVGFEPDTRSYSALQNSLNNCNSYTLHQKALWSHDGDIWFNFCSGWQQSSHFKPNYEFVNQFPQKERFLVEKSDSMPVMRAENVIKSKIDFIKIDTQGGELEILRGFGDNLNNIIGLELEVGIAEIYEGQPELHAVSEFLKKMNFVFLDFVSLRRWERHDLNSTFGQLVFGDGLFIRSPEYILQNFATDDSVIKKYVAICCLYNRFDLITVIDKFYKTKNQNALNWKAIRNIKSRLRKFVLIRKLSNHLARLCGSEFSLHGMS